jgi:ribonuclease P protein component
MLPDKKLPKSKLLRKNSDFEYLVNNGKSINFFPFRVFYEISEIRENDSVVKLAFSIGKKKINKAVKRNYLKRILKESYRNNKFLLEVPLLNKKQQLNLLIIYNAFLILNYLYLQKKIKSLFKIIENKI